jgi:predicted membrane metal-binding protein
MRLRAHVGVWLPSQFPGPPPPLVYAMCMYTTLGVFRRRRRRVRACAHPLAALRSSYAAASAYFVVVVRRLRFPLPAPPRSSQSSYGIWEEEQRREKASQPE